MTEVVAAYAIGHVVTFLALLRISVSAGDLWRDAVRFAFLGATIWPVTWLLLAWLWSE